MEELISVLMMIATNLEISAGAEWKSSTIRIAYTPMSSSTFSSTLYRARTTILKRLFFDRNNITVVDVMVPQGMTLISQTIHEDKADLSSVPMPMQDGDSYISHLTETVPLRLVENKLLRQSYLMSNVFTQKLSVIGLCVILLALVFRRKRTFGSRSIGSIAFALIGTIFGQGHAIFARRAPVVFGIYLFACLLVTSVLKSEFTSKLGETSISRHTSLEKLKEAVKHGQREVCVGQHRLSWNALRNMITRGLMNQDSKYTLEPVKRCLMQMAQQRRLLTVSFEDELHYHRNYLLKAGWGPENFQVLSSVFGETFKSVQYNPKYPHVSKLEVLVGAAFENGLLHHERTLSDHSYREDPLILDGLRQLRLNLKPGSYDDETYSLAKLKQLEEVLTLLTIIVFFTEVLHANFWQVRNERDRDDELPIW